MARKLSLSNTQVSDLKEMLAGGMRPSTIANELGCNVQIVRRFIKTLEPEGNQTLGATNEDELTNDEIEKIIASYQADMEVATLIIVHRISIPKLYQLLDECGIPRRNEVKLEEKIRKLETAIALYIDGKPIYAIEEATGIDYATLNREVHRRNLPLRRQRA